MKITLSILAAVVILIFLGVLIVVVRGRKTDPMDGADDLVISPNKFNNHISNEKCARTMAIYGDVMNVKIRNMEEMEKHNKKL